MQSEGNKLQPWKVLKTEEIFVAQPWITLSVQQVHLPDGRTIDDYYQIAIQEYALIVAHTTDGRVIMERQYKHGLGRVALTVPGGTLELGEDPLTAAKRELLEETGYRADTWRSLGCFAGSSNYGCGKAHLFVAHSAIRVADPNSGDLEEMEIVLLSPEEIVMAIQAGEIGTLGGAAAIALALNPIFICGES